ncbi:hypothetical protein GIB67_028486 [Kingdonia uniflora]|uniref:Uncharacterized protein n=1 Tax=Kingdonia uniflora TaxID=39325 RepID=A0A7J7P1Y1_9MAGN|nr:hypothetical protein GIB67_028486 [Kingdonia uniflora]
MILYTLNNGSFVEFIESSFHYTIKGLKQLLFIMDAPEESPHILPAGKMVIRSTPSNDNTSSNRVYATNDIMSPSFLTPSTDNALSRRTLAQREFNRVSSRPPYTIREESSTLLPDNVTILEEQPCIMHLPNIPYPIIHSTPNFPSRTFEIEESSSARVNICSVHHDVEAVYYNLIESDDERSIDDKGNDNVNEVDKDNFNGNDKGMQLERHFLVQMDHCSALHWKDEQLSKSSIIKPLFGQCCLQGKIKVLNLDALSNEFQ